MRRKLPRGGSSERPPRRRDGVAGVTGLSVCSPSSCKRPQHVYCPHRTLHATDKEAGAGQPCATQPCHTWKVRRRGVRGVRAPLVRTLRTLRGVSVHISTPSCAGSPQSHAHCVHACLHHGARPVTWKQRAALGLLGRPEQLVHRGGAVQHHERHRDAAHRLQALHRHPRHIGKLAVRHLHKHIQVGEVSAAQVIVIARRATASVYPAMCRSNCTHITHHLPACQSLCQRDRQAGELQEWHRFGSTPPQEPQHRQLQCRR